MSAYEPSRAIASDVRHRRTIAAIAAGLATEFAVLGLRQSGVIRHLPDPPLPGFDSNAVITSPSAYPLGIPDTTLAVMGLGGILAAATASGSPRHVAWDLALAGGVAIGAASAAYYLREMVRQRRLCAYCLVGVTGFFALVPQTVRALQAGRRARAHA